MSKPTDKEVMATGEPEGELIYRINLRPSMEMGELMEHHRLAKAAGETLEQRALRLLREDLAAEAAAA